MNSDLPKSDVRIVLNRGWQELKKAPSGSKIINSDVFRFDNAESRKNVCELAALVKENHPTYFLTYTCGQSTHPGLRKIFKALRRGAW